MDWVLIIVIGAPTLVAAFVLLAQLFPKSRVDGLTYDGDQPDGAPTYRGRIQE